MLPLHQQPTNFFVFRKTYYIYHYSAYVLFMPVKNYTDTYTFTTRPTFLSYMTIIV
nr:MAG TPA: hypothetical protein [Caudoviricetes sp.]